MPRECQYVVKRGYKAAFWNLKLPENSTLDIRKLFSIGTGRKKIASPIELLLKEKKRCEWIDAGTIWVISLKLKELFLKHDFIGWDTFQISIRWQAKLSKEYFGLIVKGKAGKNLGDDYVVKIDENKWDGKDFFVQQCSDLLFVTEKVKKAVEKAKLTSGIEFQYIDPKGTDIFGFDQ